MKIALIGGSGFVGSHLIKLLLRSKNIEVINIDKAASQTFSLLTYIGNVLDKDALVSLLQGVDLVVLLAAEHRDDVTPVSNYYDVNVTGMKNTLQAMEANGIERIIFTSSVALYGLDKNYPNENYPVDPFNHYGKSKLEAERLLQQWHLQHPTCNVSIIRPTVIFGEGNRGNVYNLLSQIASGQFVMIGNGNNRKSMAYVGNVTAFIQFLIEKKTEGFNVYNYADKPDLCTNALVFYLGKILNKEIPTIHIPYWLGMFAGYCFDFLAFLSRKKMKISSVRIRKFCATTQYDSSRVIESGFIAPYTLEEGLKRMIEKEFIGTM